MKLITLSKKQFSTDLIFAQDSGTSIENQKAMSLGAFLAWSNDYPVNALFQPKHKIDAQGLKDYWDITDTDSAQDAIEWLLTDGHRAYWADTLAVYRDAINDENSRAVAFAQNLQEALPIALHYRLISSEAELLSQKIDAWDYGRVVYLASESFYLGYLTEEQAMGFALRALQQSSKTYLTWAEYARSYLLGRLVWGGARSDSHHFVMVMMAMLQYEDSTWNRHPLDPFHKKQYEQEKQQLLAEPISRFKANRAVENSKSEGNTGSNNQTQTSASSPVKTNWLHRMVDIPLLGHYIGFLIAVVVPLLLMFLVIPAIHAVFGEGATHGRGGSNVFGAVFCSLTFIWNYYLTAKKNLRLTTPIIPIPLTWVSGFFAVIAIAAIFL